MYDDWQPKQVDFVPPFDEQDEKENFNGNVSNDENDSNEDNNRGNSNGGKKGRSNKSRNQKNKPFNNRSSSNNNNNTEIDSVLKEEAYNVVGSSINVLNELGTGLPLECYEKAMLAEFKIKEVPYIQNQSYEVVYKEIPIGNCEVKLIAYEKINVWIIVEDNISDYHIASMLNHLKVGKLQAGLIFNFKYPKLQWQRVIA